MSGRRAPGLRLHSRTMQVQGAEAHIKLRLIELQQEYDLTDIEMLQILHLAQLSVLKWMLRAERHPDDPDRKADEE